MLFEYDWDSAFKKLEFSYSKFKEKKKKRRKKMSVHFERKKFEKKKVLPPEK